MLRRIIFKRIKNLFLGLIGIILILLAVLLFVGSRDFGSSTITIGQKFEKLILSNVNIIDVESDSINPIVRNRKVILEYGVIASILSNDVQNPVGYEIVDGNGGYLVPGLIDMHSHVFDRSDLAQYLAYGGTTVRNMMGFPMHLRWSAQIENNAYPGARIITATPTLNSGPNTSPFHKNLDNNDNIKRIIEGYKADGYDFVKVYDGLNLEQTELISKVAFENKMYVAGHPPHDINIDTLLSFNFNSFEHVEEVVQGFMDYELDTVLGRKIAKKFSSTKNRLTVTLSPFYNIYKTTTEGTKFLKKLPLDTINPFVATIGDKSMSNWINPNKGTYEWNVNKYECMVELTKIFYEEDVILLLGTDTGPSLTTPGATLIKEMSLLEEIGIEPFDIIKSGTINSAVALQMDEEIGSIQVGKNSEFILLSENPLINFETLDSPKMIFNKDIYYDSTAILDLKKLGRDKSSTFQTLGRFLNHLLSK